MQLDKPKISVTIRPKNSTEKVFENVDGLAVITQFLEDRDLLNFFLVSINFTNSLIDQVKKSTYQVLTRSKAMEVRLLKHQLKNANNMIEVLY